MRPKARIMPELPEVQTIINGLNKKVLEKEIQEIVELRSGTVLWQFPVTSLGKVESISRRGKYIILQTTLHFKLIIHLRMTGKIIFENDLGKTSSYSRAEIIFSDRTKLIFDDVRTFGKIEIMKKDDDVPALQNLGVEPLSDEFNAEHLLNKLSNRKAPIKNVLLDQSVIAGLGNIYVAEILFRAKIHPVISANKIKMVSLKKIVLETKSVLKDALKHNGTTISDYRSVEDKTGEYQNFLKVYGKKTCECGKEISKIQQAGRSTYFCNNCQI
ncbi:MAG: bifunctional DNA-formamidopyrimidine glycosylase/DNA-(apurinic or apyrimidinic site) lyase [Candidatus Cloacimonetes bacterium]|nr:bifunctional DNA-formamidopyrimidine glycosylase/DNA-(apurinic or apyrimidinic site) lyase [Candidatus Cloacimonadota bacterium]